LFFQNPFPVRAANSFSYSISGFIAEPSQSANVRNKSCGRPIRPEPSGARGATVCVLFCDGSQDRSRFCKTQGAPEGVERRSRPRVSIFPWKAPVLNPRPEFASPYRILSKPAGGPSPAGANFHRRHVVSGPRAADALRRFGGGGNSFVRRPDREGGSHLTRGH